jgi:hypothetical protein
MQAITHDDNGKVLQVTLLTDGNVTDGVELEFPSFLVHVDCERGPSGTDSTGIEVHFLLVRVIARQTIFYSASEKIIIIQTSDCRVHTVDLNPPQGSGSKRRCGPCFSLHLALGD